MNPHAGSCCFFPWMYWCFSWHCLFYLARFARFHIYFNFTLNIWPQHIRMSKGFDSNEKGLSWSSIKIFSFFLIGIHSLQDWTATMRYGVTKKKVAQKDYSIQEICLDRTYSWKMCVNSTLKVTELIGQKKA